MMDYTDDFETPQPLPIGGWLILMAIGLVVAPLAQVASTIVTFIEPTQEIAAGLAIESYGLGVTIFLVVQMVANAIWTAYLVWLAVLFFKKDWRFPNAYIIGQLSWMTLVAVDLGITSTVFAQNFEPGPAQTTDLVRGMVFVAIWCVYLTRSERVKATFVVGAPAGHFKQDEHLETFE